MTLGDSPCSIDKYLIDGQGYDLELEMKDELEFQLKRLLNLLETLFDIRFSQKVQAL